MTQAEHDKMLARVRALLNKAEDRAATEQEADAYTAKAAELMAKYSIDAALLDALRPKAQREAVENRVITIEAPYALAKCALVNQLSIYGRVQAIRLRRSRDGRQRMHLFGHPSDLEAVEVLYTSLLLQINWRLHRTQAPPWMTPGDKRVYVRQWLYGFTNIIARRLREAQEYAVRQAQAQQTPGGPSTELVLVDRAALVKDAFQQYYPKVHNSTVRYGTGDGYRHGQDAGRQVDLGGRKLRGDSRALES